MPLYVYECDEESCDYTLEEIRPVEDRERPEACPACEFGFIRLVVTAPARTPNKWGNR